MADLFTVVGHYNSIIGVSGPTYDTATAQTSTDFDAERCAYSPDGTLLAITSLSGDVLYVYDTQTWTRQELPGVGASGSGVAPAFSPDGSLLAQTLDDPPYLRVLETAGWTELTGTPTLAGNGNDCEFSPDGSLLATTHPNGNQFSVYNVSDWSQVAGLPTLPAYGDRVAWSPDGAFLAIVYADNGLVVLETSTWTEVAVPSIAARCLDCNFSNDGSMLAVVTDVSPCMHVLETATWTLISGTPTLDGGGLALRFNADDSVLAIAKSAGFLDSPPAALNIVSTADWSYTTITTGIPGSPNDIAFPVVSNVAPTMAATLEFVAALEGRVFSAGAIGAALPFSASMEGVVDSSSRNIIASVGFSASMLGYVDWLSRLDPLLLQEVYRLTITGDADGVDDLMIGGISSWQATNQADGRSSYLQAVIPAASGLVEDLETRKNGKLIIQKGYRFSDGSERYEEILRSEFDTFRWDRGPRAHTATVSGYLAGKPSETSTRALTGVRSLSLTNGKRRLRCDIDLFLQPGMTVIADDVTFKAGYINYYVSDNDKFCEIGER